MRNFNWACPFCDHHSVVSDDESIGTIKRFTYEFHDRETERSNRFVGQIIICSNEDCKKFTLQTWIQERTEEARWTIYNEWGLIPSSGARPFPSYIPAPLLEDYQEACLIRDLSAKASATLARRCLQGMIRDFWGVRKPRLIDEIDAIEDKVDPSTWEAIDAVRRVGNIGAHMEKDINLVIDVDPDEAQLLIELIETLFSDWFIARHNREERMEGIKALAAEKDALRKASPLTPTP